MSIALADTLEPSRGQQMAATGITLPPGPANPASVPTQSTVEAQDDDGVFRIKLTGAFGRKPNAAIQELTDGYPENPLNDSEILIGDARVELNNGRDGRIRISSIETMKAGQGAASKALDTVLAVADKHGIGVELIASPYGSEDLNTRHLKSWYARHGFMSDGTEDGMVRTPRVVTDETCESNPVTTLGTTVVANDAGVARPRMRR